MKKPILTALLVVITQFLIQAQAVYVDSNNGDDSNNGTKEAPFLSIPKAVDFIKNRNNDIYTIKINPGIYILESHLPISTNKDMTGKRITIEAVILPDDPSWTPEKMPVITSKAMKGEIEYYHWVVSFLIEESHVTIRGLNFQGYFYPQTRYFPIARINKTKTDLLVEQCMFIGDSNISQLQVGVIAHGNEVMVNHCVFYKLRNTVVFFQSIDDKPKFGNGLTNSIIYGANQAVWTVDDDKDFRFENNIISNCRYVWVRREQNVTKYRIDNSIIVNNQFYQGIPDSIRLKPEKFEIIENNVVKKGEITLRLIDQDDYPLLNSVDEPLPIDYMHIVPGTLGYEIGAGLFKKRK